MKTFRVGWTLPGCLLVEIIERDFISLFRPLFGLFEDWLLRNPHGSLVIPNTYITVAIVYRTPNFIIRPFTWAKGVSDKLHTVSIVVSYVGIFVQCVAYRYAVLNLLQLCLHNPTSIMLSRDSHQLWRPYLTPMKKGEGQFHERHRV